MFDLNMNGDCKVLKFNNIYIFDEMEAILNADT